jgi:hypothetical protein
MILATTFAYLVRLGHKEIRPIKGRLTCCDFVARLLSVPSVIQIHRVLARSRDNIEQVPVAYELYKSDNDALARV